MSVLKHTNLIATVNSETISADPRPRTIAISELWDIAVMGYDTFPIFTWRYPWEGSRTLPSTFCWVNRL
jgi:hypothetical protein